MVAADDRLALRPRQPSRGSYWPGKRFVDWVGADIYSAYATPGVWAAFKRFYRKWRRWPFVVGEYSPWDNDYRGRFTRKLFKFALRHGRTRMLIYYRSVRPDTPFDIDKFPRAKRVLAAACSTGAASPHTRLTCAPGTPPAPQKRLLAGRRRLGNKEEGRVPSRRAPTLRHTS